jgi:hypothetical protein
MIGIRAGRVKGKAKALVSCQRAAIEYAVKVRSGMRRTVFIGPHNRLADLDIYGSW